MMRPRLRLYTGEEQEAALSDEPRVTISFGEFSRIVIDASDYDRTWLSDFEGETLQIPEDLYEVLAAYRRLRPGA